MDAEIPVSDAVRLGCSGTVLTHEIKLDFDGELIPDYKERILWVCHEVGLTILGAQQWKTARGYHVLVRVEEALHPVVIVALQAILCSDYKRETYNLRRAVFLAAAPAFWHSRWNVLYSEKLGKGIEMIDPDKHRRTKPSLRPEALEGAMFAVVTIARAEEVELPDGLRLVVEFEEFPNNVMWPNVTSLRELLAGLGNEETEWIGKHAVIMVKEGVKNPNNGTREDVIWIAPAKDWGDHIKGAGLASGEGSTPAKKAKPKSTRKSTSRK